MRSKSSRQLVFVMPNGLKIRSAVNCVKGMPLTRSMIVTSSPNPELV